MNPYAAPKARLEQDTELGTVWREGSLVRFDRDAALPPRCVVCNEDSGGARLSRKLYWAPAAWNIGALLTPFVAMGAAIAFGIWPLAALFWPLVLVLMVAHVFIRKSLKVELGLCARHRRVRAVLLVLSFAGAAAIVCGGMLYSQFPWSPLVLWGGIAGVLGLAIAQRSFGIYAVTLRRLTAEHAWLGGTGSRFRETLPELPG